MIFPFIIKHTKQYKFSISNEDEVLKILAKEFKKLKVDQTEIKEKQLSYTNGLFNGQGKTHVLAPIDTGLITVNKNEGVITFEFSTMRTFYLSTAIAVLTGIFLQDKLIGLGLFFWVYGLNIITTVYRLPFLLKTIMKTLK